MNTLPLFFISKQKHLGKGPEIIPLLEAWLPVLRANLETAQVGCPFLLVPLERLWTVLWGDPLPTGAALTRASTPQPPLAPQLTLYHSHNCACCRHHWPRHGPPPTGPHPGLASAQHRPQGRAQCPGRGLPLTALLLAGVVGEPLAAQPGPDRAPIAPSAPTPGRHWPCRTLTPSIL